jgi:putative transposase
MRGCHHLGQRGDLDRQVARLTSATSNRYEVGEVVCEVGSGLNGKRSRLRRILSDPCASVVVVEHRDRLARFGVEYLEAALAAHGRRVVIATPDGAEVGRVCAPKSLSAAQTRLRILQHRAARQRGPYDPQSRIRRQPSQRWRRTAARIGRTHAHAAAVRRDVLHKATTTLAQQHQVVVVETLNASGMRAKGGARKRGLNRALADAALAEIRRMLRYKTRWYGSHLVEADRFYPSSKTCSACGRRKSNLTLAERIYDCDGCGVGIDRDLNAAINLARLGEPHKGEQSPAGSGPVAGRGATQETEPASAGDAAGREASTPHHRPVGQTGTASPQGEAA